MSKRFHDLEIPHQWKNYWTKYPHGFTIYEALIDWINKVNDMVTNVNDWNEYLDDFVDRFDDNLADEVIKTLMEWQDSGFLEVIINQALETRMDDLEREIADVEANLNTMVANVKDFGALGDGISDDRQAIQDAIDSLPNGGTVFFPVPDDFYNIASSHDIHTEFGLVIKHNNLKFQGAGGAYHQNYIKTTKELKSVFAFVERKNGVIFEDLMIDANYMSDYCLLTDGVSAPYLSLNRCEFTKHLKGGFKLQTYVTNITRCVSTLGREHGFILEGESVNHVSTSVTFSSCYANTCEGTGFYLQTPTYVSLNSCAVDNCELAYQFKNAYGVNLNACGAEKTTKLMEFAGYRGINISTFYSIGCGGNPDDYLIEFKNGENAVLTGLTLRNNKEHKKKLGLTANNYGFENITVLDYSVSRDDIDYVGNYFFKQPIKLLRGDQSTKNTTVTIESSELPAYLESLAFYELNHTLTINLVGKQPDSSNNRLQNLQGSGTIIIQGESDNKAVELIGNPRRLYFSNCTPRIVIKDLTVKARDSGTAGHYLIEAENCNSVSVDNVYFKLGDYTIHSGLRAFDNSIIFAKNIEIDNPSNLLNGVASDNGLGKVFHNYEG